MIRARYRCNGRAHSLVVVGHADYDDHGKDIVCAGCSGVVYALIGFLHNQEEADARLTTSVESGETLIFWRGEGIAVEAAFQMAVIGLGQIAQRYPDHVAVDYIFPHQADDTREKSAEKGA